MNWSCILDVRDTHGERFKGKRLRGDLYNLNWEPENHMRDRVKQALLRI